MNSKECLEKIRKDYEIMGSEQEYWVMSLLNTIQKDLDMLDEFKKALIIERKEYNIEFGKEFSINDYVNNITVKVNHMVEEKQKKAFTQWIIDNFDKDVIKRWLENER